MSSSVRLACVIGSVVFVFLQVVNLFNLFLANNLRSGDWPRLNKKK